MYPQSAIALWTKIFGGSYFDGDYAIQQTTDGGYIITGHTRSFGAGISDVWLIRTNASDDTLWTKTFGGDENDYGYAVQQTTDGGYIITGYTFSFGAVNDVVWIIKVMENMMLNGDFSDGDNNWDLFVDTSASANGSVVNEEYKI